LVYIFITLDGQFVDLQALCQSEKVKNFQKKLSSPLSIFQFPDADAMKSMMAMVNRPCKASTCTAAPGPGVPLLTSISRPSFGIRFRIISSMT
jgi:hypothetical protein